MTTIVKVEVFKSRSKKEGPNSLGGACPGLREEIEKSCAAISSGDGLRRHPNVRHHHRHRARRRHRRDSLERWPRALRRQNYAPAKNCRWALNIRSNFRVAAQLADRSAPPTGYSRDSTRPPNFRSSRPRLRWRHESARQSDSIRAMPIPPSGLRLSSLLPAR
jgi:hypothetical protein